MSRTESWKISSDLAAGAHGFAGGEGAQRLHALRLDRLQGILGHHVLDLVGQDRGQLVLVGGHVDDAAREEDDAARGRKSVGFRAVQQAEMVAAEDFRARRTSGPAPCRSGSGSGWRSLFFHSGYWLRILAATARPI